MTKKTAHTPVTIPADYAQTIQPQHTHDCASCVFLGRNEYNTGRRVLQMDLYIHTEGADPSLVARLSSDPPDYLSTPLDVFESRKEHEACDECSLTWASHGTAYTLAKYRGLWPLFTNIRRPKLYRCVLCNTLTVTTTNHNMGCYEYCSGCSWKSSGFSKMDADTIFMNGSWYRRHVFIFELPYTPNDKT